jgi:quinolinate synthase
MVIKETVEERIMKLKRERNAVILAHNYQPDEVQEMADFTGDSLELSQRATKIESEVIVFCGVHFMAETAAILNPDKVVLIPEPTAGCPMADMVTAAALREMKSKNPEAIVVCYVNTSADVKAESDYCCTSANAADVVNALPADKPIIFVPDKNLGQHVADQTGRKIILWPGYCPTHAKITEADLAKQRQDHPKAIVMVHPECTSPVRKAADEVLSTGQMAKFARNSSATEFIVGTEVGILYRLRKENPGKSFYPVREQAICPNMKKITLEKILWSLEDMSVEVRVPEDIRLRAKISLERMLAVSK